MSGLRCKGCGEQRYVKHGFARGKQRYRCKACGRDFTDTPKRGKPEAMKALAVSLYAQGNMTYGMLAKQFSVSEVAVYKWIRAAAERLPAPDPALAHDADTVILDEMWHFVNGKKTPSGSGKPGTAASGG
jgi:transposase-like protein